MKRFVVGLVAIALTATGLLAKEKAEQGGGKGFAGMVGGTVVERNGNALSVEVTKIEKAWKHNKMENPEKLVGTRIKIVPGPKSSNVDKYARTLKAGDADDFDVRQEGGVFQWLELTRAQRAKIGVETK